jgi:hypothetical protein
MLSAQPCPRESAEVRRGLLGRVERDCVRGVLNSLQHLQHQHASPATRHATTTRRRTSGCGSAAALSKPRSTWPACGEPLPDAHQQPTKPTGSVMTDPTENMAKHPRVMVELHTGEQAAKPVMDVVAAALREIREADLPAGLLAWADLVALARDPSHRMDERSLDLAGGLLEPGIPRLDPQVAAVIRASASGSGLDAAPIDPVTGQP